jgi:hypothetical protein
VTEGDTRSHLVVADCDNKRLLVFDILWLSPDDENSAWRFSWFPWACKCEWLILWAWKLWAQKYESLISSYYL